MKKLILFILLFVTLKVSAQQTYFTPAVPPSSLSFTPSFRFKNGIVDSLNNIYVSIGNKWYQVYTAAQANARFTGGGGTSTGINGLNGTASIGLGGTLTGNTYIHNGGHRLSLDSLYIGSGSSYGSLSNTAINFQSSGSLNGGLSSVSLGFTSGATNYFNLLTSGSGNTITGLATTVTPKWSFTVNPALGATSTVGYVPTATNTSGDWSWTAPASNSLLKANNLSDVNSVDTSRKNLGFQTIWNRKGPVLVPSIPADQNNVGEANVIYDANPQILTTDTNVFKMVFTGGYSSPNLYYAESPDGASWVKYASAIITNHNRGFFFKNGSTYIIYAANLANTQLDEYTSSTGIPGSFTLAHAAVVTASGLGIAAVYSPYVFIEGGVWKMMLECNNGNEVVFYLTSTDGVTWTQPTTNPVISTFTAGNPQVFKVGSTYWMYGHGTGIIGGAVPTDIYRQSSPDLITWSTPIKVFQRRQSDEGPSLPNAQVGDITMLPVANSVYMWYVATKDGTIPGSLIKLAIANMPITQLVKTTEGDGGDIGPQSLPFSISPTNALSYTGADYSSFTLNAPNYPSFLLSSNGSPVGNLGSGYSSNLTGKTDLSLIATGSGNMSLEASHLYIYANTIFPATSSSFGLTSSNSYLNYNFNAGSGNFYWNFAYKGTSNTAVTLTDAGNQFTTPQHANDFLFAGQSNMVFSSVGSYDQVDAFAEFNVTSKSLILNGGNSAGFTDDANLILNLQSTTKGASFSPMTTTQRTAISLPTESELVYDLTLHNYYFHNGTAWTAIGGGSSGVTSVTGTASRITSTGGATPVIDISASYAGQSSIVNVGTLVSGVIDFSLLSGTPPTWNQNTTGTASNITTSSNSTLTTLSALSLPYSQLTGTPSLSGYALQSTTISAGTGLSGGGSLAANRTVSADTTVLQTVLNLKPLGSTYWVPLARTVNGKALSSNITLGLASSDFANQGTTTTVLHGNAGGNPSFSAVSLTADITGVAPIANGGTNLSSYTTGDLPYASATNVLSKLAIGATGNPIIVIGGVPAYSNLVLTNPASAATFTLAAGKTFTNNNTLTINSTDGITMTTPTTSFTAARTDAAQTFTGHQTIEGVTSTGAIGTGNLVFSISPTITGTLTTATISAGASSITGGTLNNVKAGAGTTPNAGIALTNSTAATVGTQNQYGLDLTWTYSAWNTGGTPSANQQQFTIEPRGINGATTGGTIFYKFQNNGGGFTDAYSFGSNGTLSLLTVGGELKVAEGSGGFAGQTTLVAGTKAITITGVTTASRAFVQLVTQGGTSTAVYAYGAVCTANTLTITAETVAGVAVNTDTSIVNYFIVN